MARFGGASGGAGGDAGGRAGGGARDSVGGDAGGRAGGDAGGSTKGDVGGRAGGDAGGSAGGDAGGRAGGGVGDSARGDAGGRAGGGAGGSVRGDAGGRASDGARPDHRRGNVRRARVVVESSNLWAGDECRSGPIGDRWGTRTCGGRGKGQWTGMGAESQGRSVEAGDDGRMERTVGGRQTMGCGRGRWPEPMNDGRRERGISSEMIIRMLSLLFLMSFIIGIEIGKIKLREFGRSIVENLMF